MKYEELPPITLVEAHERVKLGMSWDELPEVVLAVSLHEGDRAAAERYCRDAVRAVHAGTRRAGLLGLGHLARRFRTCDPVSWALVQAASGDASVADVWTDVTDDFTIFVSPLPQWDKPVLVLDGARIDSLDDVWDQVSGWLWPDASHGRGMNAFNDVLRGGFGAPDEGFTIRWADAGRSAEALGSAATARYYVRLLERCHPDNRASVSEQLDEARRGVGQMLFDMLVEIIRDHGPGGSEYGDLVDLELIP